MEVGNRLYTWRSNISSNWAVLTDTPFLPIPFVSSFFFKQHRGPCTFHAWPLATLFYSNCQQMCVYWPRQSFILIFHPLVLLPNLRFSARQRVLSVTSSVGIFSPHSAFLFPPPPTIILSLLHFVFPSVFHPVYPLVFGFCGREGALQWISNEFEMFMKKQLRAVEYHLTQVNKELG